MRTVSACLTMLSVILTGMVVAQTKTGIISSSETWSGTVTVTGDVLVTGGTLTISPGTVVKFALNSDNTVHFGATDKHTAIWLVITQGGGIKAEGTAGSPITMTSSSLSPSPGSWGRVEITGLTSATNLSFKYINFEYATVGVEMRENVAIDVAIDNCTFKNFSMSGIYSTSGPNANITNCVFDNMGSSGVFIHGGANTLVENCYISNSPTGIINAGLEGYESQKMTINHCTIYNIDMMLSGNPKWWTGYGIYHTPNKISPTTQTVITNNIAYQSTLANMKINNWPITKNNNCWCTGLMGLMNIEDGDPDATSIDADPLFTNASAGDLSLQAGSPCLNAASDGSNMGAWQGGPGIHDWYKTMRGNGMTISDMPVVKEFAVSLGQPADAVLGIYNINGTNLRTISGTQVSRIAWDCKTTGGSKVAPGIYLFKMQAGGELVQGNIVVAR